MKNRKRQYRELSDITKQKISKSTIGKSKSHRRLCSRGKIGAVNKLR